jgi:mannose/fructose/N-acetylgalactosamine-specific phosphotransferase system component IIB
MSVILYRVDDRLIHGQVTVGWARALQPDRIIIVDDEVAANPWEEKLFRSAAPEPLEVSVWSSGTALDKVPGVQESEEKAFLLTRDLETMVGLMRGGIEIPSINLGGLHFSSDKKQVLPYISFSASDLDILRDLKKEGIEIDIRDVPTTEKRDIFQLLKSRGLE